MAHQKAGNIRKLEIELVENGYIVTKTVNSNSYLGSTTKHVFVSPSDVGNHVTETILTEEKRRDLNGD